MVLIKWLGHACFEIKGNVTIVTDPHDGASLGLKPPESKADIILVSHTHYDHYNGVDLVKKPDSEVLVNFIGEKIVKGVKIRGIKTYHDPSFGAERGENVVYVFELDNLTFCHMGDLGQQLGTDTIDKLGKIDVLFIPVGGVYTIDAEGASQIINQIKPKIVIPMHFKVPGLTLGIASVEKFIAGKRYVKRFSIDTYEVSKESLPEETTIIVLNPSQ
ncbi:MAG: MBL fold metallo-hydrolase [Candidatus Odinarchaeia archaeon]